MAAVIVVAGEALVDLIVDRFGSVAAALGGGPYNVSRTVARLGQDSVYLGLLSDDRFGRMLERGLTDDGVRLAVAHPVDLPTTLAVAELGEGSSATYRFYSAGTSAVSLRDEDVPAALLDAAVALHVGTLGLVYEPVATTLRNLTARAPAHVVVMVDPNCRPSAVRDRSAYLEGLYAVMSRADVVKVSTDDLAYLEPTVAPLTAAAKLLDGGPRVVLVTDGGLAAHVVHARGSVLVPVPVVDVVDTVGAGDSFGGGFLAWWAAHGLGRAELRDVDRLVAATRVAVRVAAVTCTRRGAEPPTLADLGPEWT